MDIWIMGAGRFGLRAVERLGPMDPTRRLLVVDRDARALCKVQGRAEAVCAEAADFLSGRMGEETPDWVVPAVPVHLAFLWMCRELAKGGAAVARLPVPEEAEARVPHPMRGEGGCLYMSYADFFCPDNCPEPAGSCTRTGAPRPANLFDVLAGLCVPGTESIAIRSRQLAPGVGGYRPGDLFAALSSAKRAAGKPLIVSTACRCHGLADCLLWEQGAGRAAAFPAEEGKEHSDPRSGSRAPGEDS